MEYPENSLDTGKTEDGFFKFKSTKEHIGPYSSSYPADILSRYWEFAGISPLLLPPLFWKGDIGELTAKTKGSDRIFTRKIFILVPNGPRIDPLP